MFSECFVLVLMVLLLLEIAVSSTSNYTNQFGEGYGKDWIFIPDGNGALHFVNLTGDPIPSPRSSMGDVSFRLYTRKNKDRFEDLSELAENENLVEDAKVKSLYFDSSKLIKLITHGWMSNGNSNTVLNIKDAYLKKYDVNVIAVDWAEIADNIIYPLSAINTKQVGRRVAHFLDGLATQYGVVGSQIQLVGHSLGAHVMGVAAAVSRLKIARITGLDPARPMFEVPTVDESRRLDAGDAELVDAIHTCAGVLGFSGPLGHADFFPNGGLPGQPGCRGFQAIIESCSHGRSHEYFTASIESPTSFKAYRCDSWEHFTRGLCHTENAVLMGDALQPNVSGTYYLYTDPPPSFHFGN